MNFINKVEKEYHESGQIHRRAQTANLNAAGAQLTAGLLATPSPSAVAQTTAPKVELGVPGHCGSIATVTVQSMTEYKVGDFKTEVFRNLQSFSYCL